MECYDQYMAATQGLQDAKEMVKDAAGDDEMIAMLKEEAEELKGAPPAPSFPPLASVERAFFQLATELEEGRRNELKTPRSLAVQQCGRDPLARPEGGVTLAVHLATS